MANYHVTQHPEGGWVVKKEGSARGTPSPTQRSAEKIARQYAHNSGGGEIVIHRRDGRIRDSDTIHPAHDPFPPRDRRR